MTSFSWRWSWPTVDTTVILSVQDHPMKDEPSCEHCGAPFIPLRENQRFCCRDCAGEAEQSAPRARSRRQQDCETAEVASAARRAAGFGLTAAERQVLWGLPYVAKTRSSGTAKPYAAKVKNWSGRRNLNPRSPGPEPGAIPGFAASRRDGAIRRGAQFCLALPSRTECSRAICLRIQAITGLLVIVAATEMSPSEDDLLAGLRQQTPRSLHRRMNLSFCLLSVQ